MTHLHQIRSSVLSKQEELPCKTVIFDVTSGCGTVGDGDLPRGNATNASESVSESFVTSGVFSTLEGIARQQADERVVGGRIDEEGDSMVRIPPMDDLLVWLWELKVVKNLEVTVSKLCSSLIRVRRKRRCIYASRQGKIGWTRCCPVVMIRAVMC